MARVCTHCGEMYDDRKLVCPGCGAEPDQDWSEAPIEAGYEEPEMDDAAYETFLEREGLGKPGRRAGCAMVLLAALSGAACVLL